MFFHLAAENPERAEAVVRAITWAAEGLLQFPTMGRAGAIAGTRERTMTRYRYKIVYRVSQETLEILRIIHMSRNWP